MMNVERRGVSEVISTIIIILIVSVVGSLLFAYSSGLLQSNQDRVIRENQLETDQARERFKFTAVWWNSVDDVLNITVYNYGAIDLEVNDIYIDGVRVQSYLFGQNELIKTEMFLKIAFTSPVAISEGETYSINIVSANGVSKVGSWEA